MEEEKRAKNYNPWGFGSDGYLYDFVKRVVPVRRQTKRRMRDYGFGSDGYLYDFVRK